MDGWGERETRNSHRKRYAHDLGPRPNSTFWPRPTGCHSCKPAHSRNNHGFTIITNTANHTTTAKHATLRSKKKLAPISTQHLREHRVPLVLARPSKTVQIPRWVSALAPVVAQDASATHADLERGCRVVGCVHGLGKTANIYNQCKCDFWGKNNIVRVSRLSFSGGDRLMFKEFSVYVYIM